MQSLDKICLHIYIYIYIMCLVGKILMVEDKSQIIKPMIIHRQLFLENFEIQ